MGYTGLHKATQGYIRLHRVTCGCTGLHKLHGATQPQGYMELHIWIHRVTYDYKGLHMSTQGCIRLYTQG